MGSFELEASGGGTWRSGDVIDYATKLVLAGPVSATQMHRDAIASVQTAIDKAERLLGGALIDDLEIDPDTGEKLPIFLVGRQRPVLQSRRLQRFITSRPEVRHVRTRRRGPQANEVIERYHGAVKIEQRWRDLPADRVEMTAMVDDFRKLYNHVRPHETLVGARPIERYVADPDAVAAQHHTVNAPKYADLLTRDTTAGRGARFSARRRRVERPVLEVVRPRMST